MSTQSERAIPRFRASVVGRAVPVVGGGSIGGGKVKEGEKEMSEATVRARLTAPDVARIRELRYMDGLTSTEVAAVIGCSPQAVLWHAPGRPGKIDNTALREAFVASGKSASEVARALCWMIVRDPARAAASSRSRASYDVTRVKRTLGLTPDVNGRGKRSPRTLIDAETAALMAEAIGVMPWEVMPDEDDEERAA